MVSVVTTVATSYVTTLGFATLPDLAHTYKPFAKCSDSSQRQVHGPSEQLYKLSCITIIRTDIRDRERHVYTTDHVKGEDQCDVMQIQCDSEITTRFSRQLYSICQYYPYISISTTSWRLRLFSCEQHPSQHVTLAIMNNVRVYMCTKTN